MSLIFVLCGFVEKLFSGNGYCTRYFGKKRKKREEEKNHLSKFTTYSDTRFMEHWAGST